MKENTIKEKSTVKNGQAISLSEIPVIPYNYFREAVLGMLQKEACHCVHYFASANENTLSFYCAIADDETSNIYLLRHEHELTSAQPLESLSKEIPAFHIFEREIHESHGVDFTEHPWLKPVRFAHDQANASKKINDYPFYQIQTEELHEVGVGPIHAGIIEPGHFRFICNGEMVLHLEIQHGWQHRGVEWLMLQKKKLLQRLVLAESIAGDTAIGHSLAFAGIIENLAGISPNKMLDRERSIALELERIAVHVGDLSAMCTDVAYQLGNATFGALRTPVINFTQLWCGNRFGKGLIRIGGTHYPLNEALIQKLVTVLDDFETRFNEIAKRTFGLPSVLSRFENIGKVSRKQVSLIGAVGMVARMGGLPRDIRVSHPFAAYQEVAKEPTIQSTGDVYARGMQRVKEIQQSIDQIRALLKDYQPGLSIDNPILNLPDKKLKPDSLILSLTEGWRGEICHVAITDTSGSLMQYKIKDPSIHNWKALELALRNLEISDFPINNKSFDLSYCGYDL